MTIRSVDMQVMVQKTGDIARVQNAQLQDNISRQQENNSQIMNQTAKNSHTVNPTAKDEAKFVREKEEQEKERKKNILKKRGNMEIEENDKEKPVKSDPQRGHNVDILA